MGDDGHWRPPICSAVWNVGTPSPRPYWPDMTELALLDVRTRAAARANRRPSQLYLNSRMSDRNVRFTGGEEGLDMTTKKARQVTLHPPRLSFSSTGAAITPPALQHPASHHPPPPHRATGTAPPHCGRSPTRPSARRSHRTDSA